LCCIFGYSDKEWGWWAVGLVLGCGGIIATAQMLFLLCLSSNALPPLFDLEELSPKVVNSSSVFICYYCYFFSKWC
jgi:hypothetical protein